MTTSNADYPGINQQQYGIHYPLVNPPAILKDVIMDMTVSVDYPEAVMPLRIAHLSEANICVVDADGKTVFDSRRLTLSTEEILPYTTYDAYQTRLQYAWSNVTSDVPYRFTSNTWAANYIIKVWQCATVQIRLILRAEHTQRVFDVPDVWLDVRAVYQYPSHVQSLNNKSNQQIVLQAGHNINLSAMSNVVTIASVGGAGMGPYETDCGEANRTVKILGGIEASDNGSIYVTTSEGYSLVGNANSLNLSNSDTPCCKCEDMHDLGLYYNEMAVLYHELGAKYSYLRDKHAENLSRLKDRLKKKDSLFRVTVQPVGCPYFQLTVELNVTQEGCWDGAYGVLYIADEGHGGVLATEPDWKAEKHGYIGTGDYSDDDVQWYATQEVNEFVEEVLANPDGTTRTILAKKVVTRPYTYLTGELPSRLPQPYINGFPFDGNRFYSLGTHIPIHWNCKLEAGDVLRINALLKAPKLYTELRSFNASDEPARTIPAGVYLPSIEAHMLAALPYTTEVDYYSRTGLYRCVGSNDGHYFYYHSSDHYIDSTSQTIDLGCGDTPRMIQDTSEDRVTSMVARVKTLQKGKECACITDPLEKCRCEESNSPECQALEALAARGEYPPPLPACDDSSADFVEW